MQQRLVIDDTSATPIALCPCCNEPVNRYTFDMAIIHARYGEGTHAYTILEALWRANGSPVSTARLVDAMYADDPDGGPSHDAARNVFKHTIHDLRKRLQGSGVSIVHEGYNLGWRIELAKPAKSINRRKQVRAA